MKNIHVLPTNKPSSLCINGKNGNHIYITSDEKPKTGDWSVYQNDKIHKCMQDIVGDTFKKIILTTDQDLIADGVQPIADEFLEWYVNNPSCEQVEVEIETTSIQLPQQQLSENSYDLAFRWINKKVYKIIIPKEEPKQETQGYICPQTKIQCDDECCVNAENCHIESSIGVTKETKEDTHL